MEILHTSMSQWAPHSPIAVTHHGFADLEEYATMLRETRTVDFKQFANIDPHLDDLLDTYCSSMTLRHTHTDFVEINYIHSGIGIAELNNTKRILHRGDIVFVRPDDQHANYPLSTFSVYNCLISSEFLKTEEFLYKGLLTEDRRLDIPSFCTLNGNLLFHAEHLFDSMLKEFNAKKLGYEELLVYFFNQLLVYLHRTLQDTTTRFKHTIPSILDYISSHYQDVSLGQLAKMYSYSTSYLSRLFHDSVGTSFTEYINRLRINEAIKLILESDRSIEDIGLAIGFKSKMHFYEVFKKYTGFTPGVLRKQQ